MQLPLILSYPWARSIIGCCIESSLILWISFEREIGQPIFYYYHLWFSSYFPLPSLRLFSIPCLYFSLSELSSSRWPRWGRRHKTKSGSTTLETQISAINILAWDFITIYPSCHYLFRKRFRQTLVGSMLMFGMGNCPECTSISKFADLPLSSPILRWE